MQIEKGSLCLDAYCATARAVNPHSLIAFGSCWQANASLAVCVADCACAYASACNLSTGRHARAYQYGNQAKNVQVNMFQMLENLHLPCNQFQANATSPYSGLLACVWCHIPGRQQASLAALLDSSAQPYQIVQLSKCRAFHRFSVGTKQTHSQLTIFEVSVDYESIRTERSGDFESTCAPGIGTCVLFVASGPQVWLLQYISTCLNLHRCFDTNMDCMHCSKAQTHHARTT